MSDTEFARPPEMTLEEVQQTYGQLGTIKEIFYDWQGGNQWLFKTINGLFHDPNYDSLMLLITQLGEKKFFPYYFGLFAIYAVLSGLMRKIRRRGGLKQHFLMWFGALTVMFVGFIVAMGITYLLKDYFHYPRPYIILPSAEVILVEMQAPEKAYMSFPSGHVTFITLMVAALWPLLSHHMRNFGLFLIFLVAWSRVALGVHFPADAVWSFAIAGLLIMGLRLIIYTLLRKIFGIVCGGS